MANLPYLIVPALMIVRMWKPNPFGAVRDGEVSSAVILDLTGDEPVVSIDGVPVEVKVVSSLDS
jgi:hypothetical protein